MKKVGFCLCIILVIILLVGCETFGGYSSRGYSSSGYSSSGYSSNSSSSSSSSSFSSSSSKHNSYYIRSYSSNLEEDKTPISKGDLILICVDSGDYNINRPFELELSSSLEKLGLKTSLLTDYDITDKDGKISSEKYYDVVYNKILPDITIVVSFENVYVYEYGGGISKMSLSTTIWNNKVLSTSHSILISSIIEGENNMEKYYSSIETIIEKSTESIVNELKQYISK